MRFIKDQIKTIKNNDPAIHSLLEVFLYPSFISQLYHKISKFFYNHKLFFIARFLSDKGKRKTGIEIHPGATIGRSLFIDHGTGVVIGETTIIGNNVTMFHGVTLGGTGKEKGKRHPTIENNVMIGASAKVLGNIIIGENSKIGAGAIVLNDIPKNVTAVGVPAKVVKTNDIIFDKERINEIIKLL